MITFVQYGATGDARQTRCREKCSSKTLLVLKTTFVILYNLKIEKTFKVMKSSRNVNLPNVTTWKMLRMRTLEDWKKLLDIFLEFLVELNLENTSNISLKFEVSFENHTLLINHNFVDIGLLFVTEFASSLPSRCKYSSWNISIIMKCSLYKSYN